MCVGGVGGSVELKLAGEKEGQRECKCVCVCESERDARLKESVRVCSWVCQEERVD